jgi:uncharacterized protein (TIGR03067 family)
MAMPNRKNISNNWEAIMRDLFCLVLVVGILSALVGCGNRPANSDNQTDPPKSALSAPDSAKSTSPGHSTLDGVYELTELYYLGQWTPVGELKSSPKEEITFVIKGDSMTSSLVMKSEAQKIRIDETKTPLEIDILDFDQYGRELIGYGVYKVSGDLLTMAIGVADQNGVKVRPKDFAPSPLVNIMILKRKT